MHRVDHFLGRSTVLNLLGVRFANRLFEPMWSNQHIDRVDIVFDEQLTLENRARYYDRAGALMDMIQTYLLQVLAGCDGAVATVNAADLRDAKAQVLQACEPWDDDPVESGRQARYTHGSIDGRDVLTTAEPGVDPARNMNAGRTDRGDRQLALVGVPFRLRSGKALRERRKEVLVNFKPVPHLPAGLQGEPVPNRLRLTMGPDRMALEMNVNGPDDPLTLDRVSLDTDLNPGRLPAYGEVLAGVLEGTHSCRCAAIRPKNAGASWIRCCRPGARKVPMDEYAAGSDGPASWA